MAAARTKGDLENHGFGTRSLRALAERYGGSLTMRAENGVFSLLVLLPAPTDER